MKTSREKQGGKRLKLNIYMRRKLTMAFGAVSAVLFALALYIIVLMRDNGESWQRLVLAQQVYSSASIPFKRGNIVDRNQTLLAYSEEVYNLILDPSVILYTAKSSQPQPNRGATVEALVQCFGYDRQELEKLLDENSGSQYLRYARYLSEAEKERFIEYQTNYNQAEDADGKPIHPDKVTGIWFETEYKRAYPYQELACTVLGFSGAESTEGHWGLEEYYNEYLCGVNGKSYSYINREGETERVYQEAADGYTVVSTIDWYIQSVVEEKIRAYTVAEPYANVGVIVMDPSTAEILAMATDKHYNPANPTDIAACFPGVDLDALSEEELNVYRNQAWRNFAISDAYPPGSVAKELTVAMALEEAVVTPESLFVCDGGEEIMETLVRCHELDGHGTIDLETTIRYSCNDAMMNIASRLSAATMLRYHRLFGLGSITGIDLPGEAPGIIFSEGNMSVLDMATSSFGQGFSSTMIQMAASYCALINGGNYYQPRIVSRIQDSSGALIKRFEPVLVSKVVTEETSNFLKTAALHTVEGGLAAISGYDVGGKTGTANKYPIEEDKYAIGFMAFVPAQSPKLLIYAVIDEPREGYNTEAVKLEAAIMRELLEYMNIPRADQ